MATGMLKLTLCSRQLTTLQRIHGIQHFTHMQSCPLLFHTSAELCAEPKRKKKSGLDPNKVMKRTKQQLEKRVKELEKYSPLERPVDEVHIPHHIFQECRTFRQRKLPKLSEEEINYRNKLSEEYAEKYIQCRNYDRYAFGQLITYQKLALQSLREESEELYQSAIQLDERSLPFSFTGPTETPPIQNYESPDGEYVDISKKY